MLMINDNDYSKYYDKSNIIKINQWIRKIITLLLTSAVKNYNNRDFKNIDNNDNENDSNNSN